MSELLPLALILIVPLFLLVLLTRGRLEDGKRFALLVFGLLLIAVVLGAAFYVRSTIEAM